MPLTNPNEVGFIIKYLAEIVTGIVVIFLAALRFLGKREPAMIAEAIIKERPVSHEELTSCKLAITETINDNFLRIRKDFNDELKDINKKLDAYILLDSTRHLQRKNTQEENDHGEN